MGITGLLPILKNSLRKRHISGFKNKKIGIDISAWLYQILNHVSEELYFGINTQKHIQMLENKIKNLLSYKIIPIMVFDGDSLESKEITNERRSQKKNEIKTQIESLLKRSCLVKARELMKRCISVDRKVVLGVVRLLQKKNIEYIISPYEADAQLCYLENIGYVDFVMSEDSDLIPYGCSNILYKYDNSYVDHFTVNCLKEAKDDFFQNNIQDICIFSGCDYADSLPGIGIQKAYKLLHTHRSIEKVLEVLKLKIQVPKDYYDNFKKAKTTFNHQIIYDPISKCRRYLKSSTQKYDFLGVLDDIGYKIELVIKDKIFNKEDKIKMVELKRHFIPKSKEPVIIKEVDKYEKEVIVDENLVCPYFK